MPAAIPIIATVAAGGHADDDQKTVSWFLSGHIRKEAGFARCGQSKNGGLWKDCVCWHPVFL